jgi:hypothetical protein
MRRALSQPRFDKLELTDGQIWGNVSESTYDPFDLYERGMAPHLAFANAKDPLKWLKEYGPLFGFTSAYSSTVEAFMVAQRRFVTLLNLWEAWRRLRKDIRECVLTAMTETGFVTLPESGDVAGLNPDWEAEARGSDLGRLISRAASTGNKHTISIGGKHPYLAAEEFARCASEKDLRHAAESILKYALFARLEGVQPDFRDQASFEATWVLRDFLQACYLMLYFDMTRKKGIRNCIECGQFFYATTKRPRFCSPECARKNRQRRYWKRRGTRLRRKRIAECRSDGIEN